MTASRVRVALRHLLVALLAVALAGGTAFAQSPDGAPAPAEEQPPPPGTRPPPAPGDQPPATRPPPPQPPRYPRRPVRVYNPRDWRDGDPIPPGYVRDTQMRRGLVIGGASTLGAAWVISIIAGAIGHTFEEDTQGFGGDTVSPEDWFPMFIPVFGPFISIATLEAETLGTSMLVLDGLVQLGGLTMLIVGAVAQRPYIRPTVQYGDVQLQITPLAGRGISGIGLSGTF